MSTRKKKYRLWYKKLGLRKANDFIYPKVLNLSDIVFPQGTILHFYKENNTLYPNRTLPYFRNISKGIVVNVLEYSDKPEKVTKSVINESSFASKFNKDYPDFKTELSKKVYNALEKNPKILKDRDLIINYSVLDTIYRWKNHPKHEYEKYRVTSRTIIDRILKLNRIDFGTGLGPHHFVILELPEVFYGRQLIKKYLDKTEYDLQLIKTFFDFKRLSLLDTFRVLYKELKEKTPLQKVEKLKDLSKINFVFVLDEKGLVVNLAELLKFDKDYDTLENSTKYDPDKLFKLLHFTLHSEYLLPGFKENEIEKGTYKETVEDILPISKTKKKGVIDSNTSIVVDEIDEQVVETEDDTIDIEDIIKMEPEEDEITGLSKTKPKYNDIEEIIKSDDDVVKDTIRTIEHLTEINGVEKKKTKLLRSIEEVLESDVFGDGKPLKDYLTISDKEVEITEKDKKLPDVKIMPDKKALEDTIGAFDRKYIREVLKKDIARTIFSLQRGGMVIKELNRVENGNILGDYEEYEIVFTDINKGTHKVKFKIPKIDEDGQYKMSGNGYVLRKQRSDLPIKKIAYNRVALSSAYGKLFIDKAPYMKLNAGYSLKKQLLKLQESGKIKNLVLGEVHVPDVILPEVYSLHMRFIKSYVYKDMLFDFDYPNRDLFADKLGIELEKLEENGKYVLCGSRNDKPLFINQSNDLYVYDKTMKKLDNFYNIVPIDKTKLVNEYSLVKIYKNYIPTVFMLSYYLGLENLLKMLGVKYDILEGRKNLKPENATVFKTKFETLVVYWDKPEHIMLFEGLNHFPKITKDLPLDTFNSREMMLAFFKDIGLPLNSITEIQLLDDLYVDPVTANVLKQMKEPTTFTGLLLRANEMLVNDFYLHPQSMKGYVIRGYEKVPQMVYSKMVEAIRQKKNEEFFGRSRLNLDPYIVWRLLNEDSASILLDDTNPLIYLKEREDVTYIGFQGRKKESMSKGTRELHPDDIGVISEGHKDSGDVGISAYLSANPVIKNLRGMKGELKEIDFANVLSTSALLAPFSTTDDSKRLNFINVQNSHVLPLINGSVYPVRTGYDSVLPYRLDKKFIGFAKKDGIVKQVSRNKIVVEYKSGKKETFVYSNWTSKEESNTSYLHVLKPNVVKDQKVKEGDVIYYDSSFFEPDIFDPTKVTYKPYLTVRTALMELNETYEDSCAISSKLANKAKIQYVKSRSIVLDATEEIVNVLNVGDSVEPSTALLMINTGIMDDGKLTEEALDILQGFVKTTPKAKIKGKIIKIQVFYNCEKEQLSESIRKLVEETEKNLIDPKTNRKFTGRVDSSYSIEGKPLDEGKVEIKFYILVESNMGTGDKAIIANQLKTTVGDIFSYPIVGENGEEIEVLFSARAIYARIVNSPSLMGTTAGLLEHLSKKVAEMYFSK